jgi:hypothetical protein
MTAFDPFPPADTPFGTSCGEAGRGSLADHRAFELRE